MNVTVNNQILAQEVRLLSKIASAKSTIPILSHLLIRATDQLELSATDYELWLKTSCPAGVAEAGVITIPAKPLLDILERLPGDADVNISDGGLIASGNFRSKIGSLPIADFPVMPEVSGEGSVLPAGVFHSLVERVEYAISDKEQKHILKGALLSLTGDVVAMVASDGKRLSVVTANRPASGLDSHAIIPTKALGAVLEQAPVGELTFSSSDRHLFFDYGRRLLISRRVEGEFPKYQRIIPKGNDNVLQVNRTELAAAIRRVGIIAEALMMSFSAEGVELSSKSMEIGAAEERLAVPYSGQPLRVTLNWKYLLDFLERASEPFVTIAGKDNKTPLLLTDGSDFINVVMVMA